MTTINDVAKLAKVSNATVSHVINKTRKVNPETIEKVEWAIRELNYQPNAMARGLKTGNSKLIGVLNYYSVDVYFAEVLTSLEAAAHDAGYSVLLRHTERDCENQGDAISEWMNKNIDGLIINSPLIDDQFHDLIEKLNCPCVLLHVDDPLFKGDIIRGNDQDITEEAVNYLIGLGHERVACIAGITYDYHTAAQRRAGYEKALQGANIPINNEWFVSTEYGVDEGYQQCKSLMSLTNPPTAIFTYSDLLAIGAMRAVVDSGLHIPKDVSIIGFDDIQLAEYCIPRLTTIYQDKKRIGELAIELILKRIENPDVPPSQIILPMDLVVRESSGPLQ
ncbi:MAG: LacI family DNA-binding transcriptional regulator [Anaerolineaceae bacterium]|nr:LacI family DNA-binding transcriptional regulator [Anaerolineaceae bacterium]